MEIVDAITHQLHQIERDANVRILYACESGSRAWGFPSVDSDYDVRFLYVHPQAWYLSIDLENKADVIEVPVSGVLDINGWDLRKALKLMRKSNSALLEWLVSPIVYRQAGDIRARLQQFIPEYFTPAVALYHYYHLALNTYNSHLTRDMVLAKKYFYALRPLLATLWIEQRHSAPPMEFSTLLDAFVTDAVLRRDIETLLAAKREAAENHTQPGIESINRFIEKELQRLAAADFKHEPARSPTEPLNRLFQSVITSF